MLQIYFDFEKVLAYIPLDRKEIINDFLLPAKYILRMPDISLLTLNCPPSHVPKMQKNG